MNECHHDKFFTCKTCGSNMPTFIKKIKSIINRLKRKKRKKPVQEILDEFVKDQLEQELDEIIDM